MIATVTNFGGSLGIYFPNSLLKNVHISENDNVEILAADNSIIIKKLEKRKHFSTKERIATFHDSLENNPFIETDWGKPLGKEIW